MDILFYIGEDVLEGCSIIGLSYILFLTVDDIQALLRIFDLSSG